MKTTSRRFVLEGTRSWMEDQPTSYWQSNARSASFANDFVCGASCKFGDYESKSWLLDLAETPNYAHT